MKTDWVLVANGSMARVLSRTAPDAALVPVMTVPFPDGRLKAHDQDKDRPGHGASDTSSASIRFEPRTTRRRKLLQQFAREMSHRLDQGRNDRHFESLTIVASSPFLGELRSALSPQVNKCVAGVYDVDLTELSADKIESRLRDLAA
ncbi:host attachment protein [Comamonas granuli]|uniref:host attachment protein n=1 Tax=Comamonas granuli TaxID=290309 RepID=UPI000A07545B|nr:host attachment protein [Comamonas granuli]